jgi:hypothetical protein
LHGCAGGRDTPQFDRTDNEHCGAVEPAMSNELYFFSENVFPICKIERSSETKEEKIIHFHGTGFTIGTEGFFLSARHVINKDCLAACERGQSLIAPLKEVGSRGRSWKIGNITEVETHPTSDVAIGKIDYRPPGFFSSKNQVAYGWEDVHVFGYPESRTRGRQTGDYEFNPHFLKGYVSRRLEIKDVPLRHYAPAYELSFPIPLGVSGSPVFRTGPDHSLLGIAVASLESAVSVHEFTEVRDGTEKYSEKVQKIEQFGIAVRLADLADWAPKLGNGRRLVELY